MKTIRVVAAVICDSMQEKRKIYATARGYGDYKGQWEFPGGKIEPGETPQQALKRESKKNWTRKSPWVTGLVRSSTIIRRFIFPWTASGVKWFPAILF